MHILAPISKSILAKLKIVSTIKLKFMYGPVAFQGMDFKNLYTLLGVTHCSMMVQFFRTEMNLGRLLQTSYECLAMELGLPNCPFK